MSRVIPARALRVDLDTRENHNPVLHPGERQATLAPAGNVPLKKINPAIGLARHSFVSPLEIYPDKVKKLIWTDSRDFDPLSQIEHYPEQKYVEHPVVTFYNAQRSLPNLDLNPNK